MMKNKTDFVSIIVPVYNVEKFIKDTINSILTQTYENFEVLLINDSSTDKSVEIIKQIKDKRIKLINNEKNSGVAIEKK